MAAPPGLTSLNIGSLYGAIYAACFVSTGLWGVSCMQTFIYYTNYPHDKQWIKLLVAGLWLADTAHQVLIIVGLYRTVVMEFGSVVVLTSVPLESTWSILPSVIVSTISQSFFTYRLWKFSGQKAIFLMILIPSILAQFAATIVYMRDSLHNLTAAELHNSGHIALGFNTLAAVTDIGLAVCMVYLLLKERTGLNESNRMVILLVIFTVNSGLWSAIVALAVAITLAAQPSPNMTFGALYFVLSSIYCNTILGNLNSRDFIRQRGMLQDKFTAPSNLAFDSDTGQMTQTTQSLEPKTFHIPAVQPEDGSTVGNFISKSIDQTGSSTSSL